MTLSYSSTVEAEVDASNLAAIDLCIINFGNNVYRFWSTTKIDAQYYNFNGFPNNANPSYFQARIIDISSKSWALDGEDTEISFTVAHRLTSDDHDIEKLMAKNGGAKLFENAKVELWRCFPNIKEVIQIWQGVGNAPKWGEFTFDWDIQFMPHNLMQSFGRSLDVTCPFVFADQVGCSYKLLKGRGLPKKIYSWTHSSTVSPSGNTYVITGSGFDGSSTRPAVQEGWFLHNATKNCYFRVTSVNSSTELEVEWFNTGYNGTKEISSGDLLNLGTPYTFCGGLESECKARGRYGTWQAGSNGTPLYVSDGRREFGGRTEASPVTYKGKTPSSGKLFGGDSGDPFTRIPETQESMDGSIIPVVFGPYRLNGIKSYCWAPAGDFQHGFFLICEGVQYLIGHPFINNRTHDADQRDFNNTNLVIQHEPFVQFNVWRGSKPGHEDDRIFEDPNNERHVRRIRWGIGARKAYMHNNYISLDTYGNGVADGAHYGLPFLFNDGYGDGISWSGITAMRVRIESNEDNLEQLTGSVDLAGTLYEVPFSWPRLEPYHDPMFDLKDGGLTYRYTIYPDFALVAYHVLTNPIWGGGFGSSNLDLESFIDFSNFCIGDEDNDGYGDLFGVDSTNIIAQQTVDQYSQYSVMVYDWAPKISAFRGFAIQFKDNNNNTFNARILSGGILVVDSASLEEQIIVEVDYGSFGVTEINSIGDEPRNVVLITIDRPFGSFEPKNFVIYGSGNLFSGGSVRRWNANGVLSKNESIHSVLTSVLDEAAANWRMNEEGKIEIVYRRALTQAELDDVVSDRFFTDKGSNRNILRNANTEESSLQCWRKDIRDIANEYSVTFPDASRDFLTTKVTVRSKVAQFEAGRRFGEVNTRRKIKKEVQLPLTSSVDQAARRLALMVREDFYGNFYCSFQTSLKTAQKIQPGDIICVESDVLRAKFMGGAVDFVPYDDGPLFFRVLKITEDNKFVRSFECQIHLNEIYNDSTQNFGNDLKIVVDYLDMDSTGIPAAVVPSTPSIAYNTTNTGDLEVVVSTEVTFPDMPGSER